MRPQRCWPPQSKTARSGLGSQVQLDSYPGRRSSPDQFEILLREGWRAGEWQKSGSVSCRGNILPRDTERWAPRLESKNLDFTLASAAENLGDFAWLAQPFQASAVLATKGGNQHVTWPKSASGASFLRSFPAVKQGNVPDLV